MVYDIDTDIEISFVSNNCGEFGRMEKSHLKVNGIYETCPKDWMSFLNILAFV